MAGTAHEIATEATDSSSSYSSLYLSLLFHTLTWSARSGAHDNGPVTVARKGFLWNVGIQPQLGPTIAYQGFKVFHYSHGTVSSQSHIRIINWLHTYDNRSPISLLPQSGYEDIVHSRERSLESRQGTLGVIPVIVHSPCSPASTRFFSEDNVSRCDAAWALCQPSSA
ncbi:hypothetical protein ARMSODRAFT_1004204, partial [Armillaria solidipes]